MAIVPRERRGGTTYYVANRVNGRMVFERVGRDKREAARRDAAMKREIKAGTYSRGGTGAQTVGAFARSFFAARTVRSVNVERSFFDRHVVQRRPWFASLRVDAVTPPMVLRLAREISAPHDGVKLARKTVSLVIGVVRAIFSSAVFHGIATSNPVSSLPYGTLSRAPERTREIYPAPDARRVLDVGDYNGRVLGALAFWTGMREGEIAGLRWGDLDLGSKPLGSITVARQYDGRPLKTDRTRRVPVHSELAATLIHWRDFGFRLVHLRNPSPTDPILPTSSGRHHSKSSLYKIWRTTLGTAGVANRSLHSARHTFITAAKRGGAAAEVVERITHNARGTVVDQYTHWEWAPLCAAVEWVSYGSTLDARLDAAPESRGKVAPAPGLEPWRPATIPEKVCANQEKVGDRIPPQKTSGIDMEGADVDARQAPGPTLRRCARLAQESGGLPEVTAELRRLARGI